MRPDLLRLVVDTDRKSAVSKVNGSGSHVVEKTIDRVGLSKTLAEIEAAAREEAKE